MKPAVTLPTAIEHLKSIFIDPSKDYLTVEEMYKAGNRPFGNKKDSWYKNRMAYFRQHELTVTKYEKKDGLPYVVGISLSERGKIALKRTIGEITPVKEAKPKIKEEAKIDFSQVDIAVKLMKRLSEEMPDKQVTFDINGGTVSINKG